MIRQFINRTQELGFLEEKYQQKSFQCIVLYGRRRIGKTELVKQFIQNKPALYFLADKRGTASNVERFKGKVADLLGEPRVQLDTFDQVFRYLVKKSGTQQLVIIIDEFPYLLEKDEAIPSILQLSIDEDLQHSAFFLILLGSSVAMMEEGVLSKKSPLYGRRTGQWKLNPLPLREARYFVPAYSLATAIELYAVLGGVPFYLAKINEQLSLRENIEQLILQKGEVLYEEIDFLLKEELRDPSTYKSILEAVAAGCSKTVEIANKANLKVQDLDKYLKTLQTLGYLERRTPITESPSSKRSIYQIKDQFVRFWFTFCFPHLSDLEMGNTSKISKLISTTYSAFTGRIFELVCQQFLHEKRWFDFQKIGSWWGHRREQGKRVEMEIDLLATNDKTKQILFGECKWQERVEAESLLTKLREKAQYVDWNKTNRTEYYVLFAKSFKSNDLEKVKRELALSAVFLVDLVEMEKEFIR